MISEATYRLIQGYFDCENLGERALRGVAEPVVVYRVLSESDAQSRLDIARVRGLTPLVGRHSELQLLIDRWHQAKSGEGQVVLLNALPGLGKSRMVYALRAHLVDEAYTHIECRSSPYFANSALYPIIDMLQRTLRFQADDTSEQKLEKLIDNLRHYRLPLEETVPLFGALLSLPVPEDRYPPLNLSPQRQRQKTLENIVAITLELAERQPVLFILEDAHWQDASTHELLDLLIDQTSTASLLILISYRPEFQPTWGNRSDLTQITLNRLSRSQIESIAMQVAGGKVLPLKCCSNDGANV
jgi:predicted ATPase